MTTRPFWVTMYPNPFTGRLTIDIDTRARVMIYDRIGSMVYESILQRGNNDLNLGTLKDGIFFARIISASGTQTFRVLKID